MQVIQRLLGKRLVLTGDSMVRQLFIRLVQHVRGVHTQIETVFHEDARFRFNGQEDHFQVGPIHEYEPLLQDGFDLIFMWAVEGIPTSRMQSTNADYAVSAVMYSWHHKSAYTNFHFCGLNIVVHPQLTYEHQSPYH